MSGFSFNKPTTMGASTGGLFGTAANNNSEGGGSLFGGVGGNKPAGSGSAGFSWGQTPATTSAGEQKSTFGATSSQPTNIFGGQTGSSFSFGVKSQENKGAESSKSPFGGFGSTQPPASPGITATPSTSAPSLFGSTTPAATSRPAWLSGDSSTTPAGPPPQPVTFSASTGGSGLFSNPQAQQNQGEKEAPKQAPFSFGPPAATTSAASPAASTQAAPAPSIFGATPGATPFGATPAAGPSLFSTKPAEKPAAAPSTGNLFGSKPIDSKAAASPATSSQPKFSFGPSAANTSNAANPSTLFSTANSATPKNTAPQAAPSMFGSTLATSQPSGSLFSPSTSSAPSAPSNLFGNPQATSASSASAKPAFSFPPASQANATSAAPSSTTAPAQKSLFGSLGGSSTTTSGPIFGATPTSTTAQSTSTPLFGVTPAKTTSASSGAAATSTAAPSGGLFGLGAPSSASTQPATTSTAPGTTQTSGLAANTGTGLGTSTLAASTTGPVPPSQSRLKNKTMDEILTRWATDLTRYTKDFKKHAETIAQWDQIIVDNSSKIDKLYIKTRTCEKQTMSVEMQLTAVENQQNELESWLSKYENDVEEMLAKDSTNQTELGGPDQDRERTYKLAEKLGEQLEDMGRNLESMVEEVNAANASLSKHTKADEPITQIVRILNSHLTQLQTIDQGTAALQAKVAVAQKSANGMGYLGNGSNGDGRAAVDDFYRSYMGRR